MGKSYRVAMMERVDRPDEDHSQRSSSPSSVSQPNSHSRSRSQSQAGSESTTSGYRHQFNDNHNHNHNNNYYNNPFGSSHTRDGSHSRKSSFSAGESAVSSLSRFTFHESEYTYRSNNSHHSRDRTPTSSVCDTHSLIKRAAKSALLDDATPTGSVIFSSADASDDEEDYGNNNNSSNVNEEAQEDEGSALSRGSRSRSRSRFNKGLPSMKSLETPSLPAIPDEQDRKRFVGCLAAVLSSMYDYESYELLEREKKNNTNNTNNTNNNNTNNNNGGGKNEPPSSSDNPDPDVSGFFDFYESDEEEEDAIFVPAEAISLPKANDGNHRQNHKSDKSNQRTDANNANAKSNANANAKASNPTNDQNNNNKNNNNNNNNASVLSATPSTDTTDNFYSRRCQSFESMGSSTVTGTTTASSTSNGQAASKRPLQLPPAPAPVSKLKPMASFRRQAANSIRMHNRNNNNGNNGNGNNGNNDGSSEKEQLSRQRYLSRRYELYSGLLLTSSELLLLDKSIARAFLPMLSRVLVPQIHKAHTHTHTRTRTHSGSGGASEASRGGEATRGEPSGKPGGEADSSAGSATTAATNATTNATATLAPEIHLLDNPDELSPFLDSLTPGAGFRCVSLFLLQHLMSSDSGYDARIRHAVKKLSILVLQRDLREQSGGERAGSKSRSKRDRDRDYPHHENNRRRTQNDTRSQTKHGNEGDNESSVEFERRRLLQATRTFEALEQNIARRLILLSSPARNRKSKTNKNNNNDDDSIRKTNRNENGITREQIVRGVKIGGAGILAGTLFAVTGGLAAPGIAAGVAAFAGAAAGTAAVSTLTSAAVVTTIFGVGGGGLAAYKMQRRTQGVTEFEFCRETKGRPDNRGSRDPQLGGGGSRDDKVEAELFSILCISGWLRDHCDYQRPWGLQPSHPRITDRLEKLERFYSVYSPEHLPKCERILASWRGEEAELWKVLREKYGRDPDHLFPLDCANLDDCGGVVRGQGALTPDQEGILDKLFVELGYHSVAPERGEDLRQQRETPMSPFERVKNGWKNRRFARNSAPTVAATDGNSDFDSANHHSSSSRHATTPIQSIQSSVSGSMLHCYDSGSEAENGSRQRDEGSAYKPPKHLSTVWDWKTTYGGEMYTVKWESRLLTQICDCVMDFAVDVVSGATRQILKQTVLHTLLSAVVWPTYLLNLAHMIDGDWTIAVERADEAGVVLAKTLLYSSAGQRPVTLVGYSFGARIIYSCLKELARYQEEWEQYHELLEESIAAGASPASNGKAPREDRRLARYKQKMKGMREPASIVEDAVLMGLPNHLSLSSWKACRQIVAGRLVNCYSNNDLILSLMFQAKRFSGGSFNNGMFSILKPVCGTCPVEEPGVENVDCSDLILGHQDYCLETGKVLERIGFGEPIRCVDEARANETVIIVSDEKP